jgi:hypothetical protein
MPAFAGIRDWVAREFELSNEAEMIHKTGKMANMINTTAIISLIATPSLRWNF